MNGCMRLVHSAHRVAAQQHFVLHRSQALACGLPPRTISRMVTLGEWQQVYPSVYLVAGAKLTDRARLMAATLWAGPSAVASHASAGWLFGLMGERLSSPLHVSVATKKNSRYGIQVHLDPTLSPSPKTFFDVIPVTRIDRTLLDICGTLPKDASARLIDRAIRSNLTEPLQLARALDAHGRQGRAGTHPLRSILTTRYAFGVTDSDAEDLFREMATRRGFNFVFHHVVTDAGFRAELDFAALPEMVDIEIDGGGVHNNPAQVDRDKARDVELGKRGWLVLRFTYRDLVENPAWVFDSIVAALAMRRAS